MRVVLHSGQCLILFGMLKKLFIKIAVLFFTTTSFAADWSQTNVQFLHGESYAKPGDESFSATVVTFEHLSSWAYGSNFFFFDITSPDKENSTGYYGEFSPAFSLGKMGAFTPPESFLKDISLQLNFEMPQGPARRVNLAGLTFEWKDIGFDYLATQFLYRDAVGMDGHTGQLTVVWLKRWGGDVVPIEFLGFVDWAGAEGTLKDNTHVQANLLYDFSRKTAQKVPLKVGMEYKYWDNKYGISGLNEQVPQAKLLWIF